ncbi:GatB/YqeY domain-containing protein [filamentous cyanobacterium LEGE 11480]|uniref:GatB/YqeY domain-containing protein n=1 Tax=Romeriopsis navalis LEGE 11480 TaxID=2777977 RepID=A0A928Z681_9CYAN|nr:GatB/YqeY domain-containing protein [Romeriopsis navalis]MBE9032762.1 GatB/YqeY domain-containing protein [Romeriopsis navalis LEGE 11480]
MSLIDQIGTDIKTAMKAKDKVRLETLRGIKKVLLDKEVSVRPSGQTELTPEQEIEALSQIAKQRRDSIAQFTDAGRADMAEQEAIELKIIEEFLPTQLTDDEIAVIVAEVVAEVGATSPKDMGKVMGPVMQKLKGKADGKKVQAAVKASLAGS